MDLAGLLLDWRYVASWILVHFIKYESIGSDRLFTGSTDLLIPTQFFVYTEIRIGILRVGK